ncbi:MAG TPA: manganese efflux pump [Syntrophomonadaceae bacterium]|nr:manganese efflux pump [Syntrophomonadaceae bacterium]
MLENLTTIIVVAIVLGVDAFSLALGLGLNGVRRRYELKLIIIIMVLHIALPLLGLSLGMAVGNFLGIWAARFGALVLFLIGLNFIYQGYKDSRTEIYPFKAGHDILASIQPMNDESFKTLLLLGFSVSIDALTVGFSLGTFRMPVIITIAIIGTVAGFMTLLGFIGGRLFSRAVGSYAQMVGGAILLILAVKLVL